MMPALLVRWLAALLPFFAAPVFAAEARVAVATNYPQPAEEIGAAFARSAGHKGVLACGTSGAFYTQISHGAPFDIFLSADANRPAEAEKQGFAVPGSRFTYAIGQL